MMTSGPGRSRLIVSSTYIPLPPGMEISSTTTEGRSLRMELMASKAMSAWPMTSTLGNSEIIVTNRSRTTGESSTTKTGWRGGASLEWPFKRGSAGGELTAGCNRCLILGCMVCRPRSCRTVRVGVGSKIEVGLQLGAAVRTDAMAETDVGVTGDIAFDPVPVIAVVADLFAVTANGEESLQGFDRREGLLQFPDAVSQGGLQLDDPGADLNPRPQLSMIERFGDVIVRTSFESLDDVLLAAPGGKQNDVGGLVGGGAAGLPANFH